MPGGSDVTAIHAWYNRSSGLGLMVVGDCANMTSATGSDVTNASSLAFEYYGILHLVVTSLILGSIILATILGNLFVVIAITLERHLQHVANYLVASLAVADLLVAALVMPLAAINEVAVRWFLGSAVCDMWIAADVLCCTSSILHLVAIALDRYLSITRLSYIRRRSPANVLVFVSIIWLLSAAVSIPPLFGWKDEGNSPLVTGRCTISQDWGYTVFSTSAAFYLPLVAIVVIYAKIYRAAQSTIRKKKFRHKRSLMLRQQREQQQQQIDCVDTNGGVPALTLTRETGSVAHAIDVNDDPESTVSLAPTNSCYTYSNDADGYDVGGQTGGASGSSEGRGSSDPDPDSCYAGMNDDGCYSSGSPPGTPPHQSLLVEAPGGHNLQAINTILVHTKQGTVFAASFLHRPSVAMDDVTAAVVRHEAVILEQQSLLHTPPLHHHHPAVAHRHISAGSKNDEHIRLVVLDRKGRAAACKPAKALKGNGTAHGGRKPGSHSRRTKAEQVRARKEQKRERKAARTLAIITGVFVASWLPFFIMAVVGPFCGDACALPRPLMSAIVWLGYLNSLVNPAIYTIFNPDFRVAFRRMLCGKLGSRQQHRGR